MAQSFDGWLNSLGPITRYTLGLVMLLTILTSMNVVPFSYILISPSTLSGLQLWRPLSAALFFGGFSFPWLMTVGMFVSYMNYNENSDYTGKSGDFLWMLLLLMLGLTCGAMLLGLLVTSFALLMALCWIFCKRHPEVRMSIYGFEFNANTFPWILLLFHLVIGQSVVDDILGVVVGHIFFFLKDIMPKTHGRDVLATPAWFLRHIMPNSSVPGFGVVHPESHPHDARFVRQTRQATSTTHQWGGGRVLGSQ